VGYSGWNSAEGLAGKLSALSYGKFSPESGLSQSSVYRSWVPALSSVGLSFIRQSSDSCGRHAKNASLSATVQQKS
jgi:hypothetical protein